MTTLYLAGPMSGIPQFNFPLFQSAAADLRARGIDLVSPAELDAEHGVDKQALASPDGDASKLTQTWADLLARDVKLISERVKGIVFLPNWFKSRGAKLEAFVGLLHKDFEFWKYTGEGKGLWPLDRKLVMKIISEYTE